MYHQLYFNYPKYGGIQALFNTFKNQLDKKKIRIITDCKIKKIVKEKNKLIFDSDKAKFYTDKIVSTIPINSLHNYIRMNKKIRKVSKQLKYNSIIICIFNIKGNQAGKNFALMIPDKKIIFHRISKLDFLGKSYSIKNSTTFEIEITYRKGDRISKMSKNAIFSDIEKGLKNLKFINKKSDINFKSMKKFQYAYVIYDLHHRKNVDFLIKSYEILFEFNFNREYKILFISMYIY